MCVNLPILGIIAALAALGAPLHAASAQQDMLEVPDALAAYAPAASPEVRDTLLWTDTLYGTIPAGELTHKVVLWCDDDILLYSLNMYAGGVNGYSVDADAIRINGISVINQEHSDTGQMRVSVLGGGELGLRPVPLALPGHGSLMIPVDLSGDGSMLLADIMYVGGISTRCHLDSFGPAIAAAPFPLGTAFGGFGSIMLDSTNLGVGDFNQYLERLGEDWQLELAVRDVLQHDIDQIIEEMEQAGVAAYLGPPDVANLRIMQERGDDIVAISCCGTSGMLDQDDHVFRTAPSESYLTKEMARLMMHNDIRMLLPVWTDDIWNKGWHDGVVDAFEKLGGTVDESIMQQAGGQLGELAPQIRDRIVSLSEAHGAGAVAVLSLPEDDVAFLRTMANYTGAATVRWFGTDYTALNPAYTQDDNIRKFATESGYTTLQLQGSGPLLEDTSQRLAEIAGRPATHDILAAYESAWIMGLAMQHTQSTDSQRLAEAIPHVAQRYSGTLGPMQMDTNGDLLGGSLEVWSVHDGQWTLAGIMTKH